MFRYVILIGLFLTTGAGYAQISSTFDVNAQGWTTPNDADGTIGYSATGGNPGGMVFGNPFVIVLGAGSLYIPFNFVAPAAYLGNRSAYYNGTLRYDIQQSTTGTPNQYAEVTIADNAGITLYYFPATPNQPVAAPAWSTYSVVFNNALGFWKTTNSPIGPVAAETQIQSILSDLATLQIRGLYRDANTTNRLDNVSFTPPIVVSIQPNAATVCNGVTATFTTAATGNPAITYRWQFESSPGVWTDLNNGGGYSNVTTATLSVNTTGNFGAGNYRCRISGTAVVDAFTNAASLTINPLPTAPGATGAARCGTGTVTLTATGGAAGQYRWYTVATGGTAIAGQTAATYVTPSLAVTTPYYVAINNGTCESTRTLVTATINTVPAPPGTTGASACGSSSVTLTATGAAAGQYRWYTVASGGTAIAGQTNATYATPVITVTTDYYVAINNGSCEGARTLVTATINTPPSAPTSTGASSCGTGSVTLSAAGGVAGQYRWYTVATGGTAIAGQTAATYVTPSLTVTTPYYVAINNGTCESTRTLVTATINTPPAAPTTTSASFCGTGNVTLSATGGTAGQYRWYTVATGGTAIAGQTNNTFITPVLTITTTYYVAINNGTCESTRTAVVATINTIPGAPSGTNASRCGSGTVVLSATGGVAGQYRWYTAATGGTAIAGQTNATYTTPILTTTTSYYVAINNGFCESTRTEVTATIQAIPNAPTVTGAASCLPASVTLTAAGGAAGQYRWYTVASGGTAIAGEINNTFTTPVLTTSTTYYVAINNGTCESLRTAVIAAIALPGCDNIPPVVDNVPLVTQIGGIVTLNLLDLISDSDNNLDLSQLAIVPPTGRWASAYIDNSFNLIIDYTGIQFSGIDSISIRVCDIYTCVVQKFGIKVVGEINIYNAISPNNDGTNDVFLIEHINILDNTRENEVSIYNRWGALVWNGTNYNNDTVVFAGKSNTGNELPSGTYFYKIEFKSGLKSEAGYLVLKR
ncbi:MAG: gliding motility-associated C-terminal domain-containing protein [Cyclobacteriaceae bacterium]|nr:gliding motility-associated C-terminal domain-containing protein [Cyclobacteriaceae bacterium]